MKKSKIEQLDVSIKRYWSPKSYEKSIEDGYLAEYPKGGLLDLFSIPDGTKIALLTEKNDIILEIFKK